MKTLLIHQPYRFDLYKKCLPTVIPRNLLVIGACLKRAGFPVRVLDMQINEWGPESITRAIKEYSPDLVGFSIHAAPFIPSIKTCCEMVKAVAPHVLITVGGIFTSTYKEKIFDFIPEIDIIVLNEGEETIVDLAYALENDCSLETVAGIVYKNGCGEVVETPPRPMLADLSMSPTPAYELIDLAAYNKPGVLPPPIEAQRGCSFSCKFCGVHYPNWERKVRYKDPKKIVDEIQLLHDKYKFRSFFFSDETITLNRNYIGNISQELIKRRLNTKMRWTAYTRADTIDSETAKLMARAGCYSLALGVETGSQDELDSINKNASVVDYKKGIDIIKAAGMEVHTLIIFGFPEVGHNDIRMTAKFIKETNPTVCQFFIFHPVPGTDFFANPAHHGLLYSINNIEDWYKFDFIEQPLCDTQKLTKEEIIKYFLTYNFAFRSYENLDEDILLQERLLRNAFPRKRKEVVILRTGTRCLYSSPFLPEGELYTDMFKNCRQLNELQYEILLHSNGDFTIEEIAERIASIFTISNEDGLFQTVHLLRKFEELRLIHKLPALDEYSSILESPQSPPVLDTATVERYN